MSSVLLLTRLQLMQTIGGFRASFEKKTGSSASVSMAFSIIVAIALVVGTGYLGYRGYELLSLFNAEGQVFSILFLVVGLLTFTFSLPSVLGTFFGDSDVSDLLSLPVSQSSVALSKALGALSMGYVWTLSFLLGPMAGWGIAAGADAVYWLTYVALLLFAPFMPVAYAGTLSILIAKFFKRVRRKDTITTLATVVGLGVSIAFFLAYEMLKDTGAGNVVNDLSQTLGGVLMAFPSYGFALYALRTGDVLSVLNFVLVSLLAFAVFVFVARMLYIKIVTSLSGGSGVSKAYAGEKSESKSPLMALARADLLKVVRSSTLLLNYVAYPALVTPLIMGFSLTNSSATELVQRMTAMPLFGSIFIMFVLPILGLFVLLDINSNLMAATAVSREGSNWIHMKFIPVPFRDQLLAKALASFAVTLVIIIASLAIPGWVLLANGFDVPLFLLATVYLIAAGWLITCVGIVTDCRRPSVEWGDDGDVTNKTVKGYAGLVRGLLVGVLFVAVSAGLDVLCVYVLKIQFIIDNPMIFMLLLDVLGIAVAVLMGNACINSAARKLEAFE